ATTNGRPAEAPHLLPHRHTAPGLVGRPPLPVALRRPRLDAGADVDVTPEHRRSRELLRALLRPERISEHGLPAALLHAHAHALTIHAVLEVLERLRPEVHRNLRRERASLRSRGADRGPDARRRSHA